MRWAERLTCWPLMRYWLRDPVERASFLLTAAQLTRARDVKLRVYPQIAQFAVYPLIFAVGSREDSYGIAAGFLSGFLGMIPLTAVGLLRYSEEYRGAELFRFAPVSSPAPLFHGARKAAQCFVFLPVLVIWVLICVLALQRPDQLLLLIPGILTGHICSLFPGTWEGFLPFSETQADRKGMGTGCVIMALGFGGAVTVGIASSMCWKYGYFLPWILALGLICLILDVVLRRVIRSKSLRMDD